MRWLYVAVAGLLVALAVAGVVRFEHEREDAGQPAYARARAGQ